MPRHSTTGHGTCTKQFLPKRVESLLNIGPVSTVACGLGHTLVLMASGLVYSWGHGTNGRLGLGHIEDRPTATLVGFGDDRVCKVRRLLAQKPSANSKNHNQVETSDRSFTACRLRVGRRTRSRSLSMQLCIPGARTTRVKAATETRRFARSRDERQG